MKIISKNYEETLEIAKGLGSILNRGDIICFYGGMGMGKTAFVTGIARGLGYSDYICSPTFTIVNQYDTDPILYHFDVYRVNDPDELFEIGFSEYFESNAIVAIEWAELILDLLPKDYIKVSIQPMESDENFREIQIESIGLKNNLFIQKAKALFGGSNESTCS